MCLIMTGLKYAVDSPHTRGWVERIGRIIMNFSAVEMESVHWLVQLTERHEDASRFFARTFTARTVEIERCIEVRGTDKVCRRKALRAWNDARELGGIRNHVAHNPLAYWWKDPVERGEPDSCTSPSHSARESYLRYLHLACQWTRNPPDKASAHPSSMQRRTGFQLTPTRNSTRQRAAH